MLQFLRERESVRWVFFGQALAEEDDVGFDLSGH